MMRKNNKGIDLRSVVINYRNTTLLLMTSHSIPAIKERIDSSTGLCTNSVDMY